MFENRCLQIVPPVKEKDTVYYFSGELNENAGKHLEQDIFVLNQNEPI